jgi:hypothetical protein
MWLHLLILTTVILQLINFWILSQGKLETSFKLLLVIYSGLIVVELALAARDLATQWSVALYVIVDAWAILMALRGLKRLKNKTVG